MSTIKISQLTEIVPLNPNTSNVSFVGSDTQSGLTGRYTAGTIADGLYANRALNVGNSAIQFPGVVGQFAGHDNNYIQINLQNLNGNGSSDFVATANNGTDSTYYVDLGIQGSNDTSGILNPLDSYLLVQGNRSTDPGGNLFIATETSGKDIIIAQGGLETDNIAAKFIYNTGFKLVHKPLIFADGTTQNTAAISIPASQLIYNQANAATAYGQSAGSYANSAYAQANTATDDAALASGTAGEALTQAYIGQHIANSAYAQANTATAYGQSAGGYANSAFAVANNTLGVDATQNTKIGLAWTTANNALANTSGTFAGDLNITGNTNVRSHLTVANTAYDYANTSLVKILGSTPAITQPANPGYMLEVVGVDGISSRIINTAYGTGAYGLYAGRHANGTAASPTATANNDIIARFSGGGHNGTGFTATGQARIDIIADENFTTANNGTKIEFYNTIPQTNTVTKIATFNANTVTFTGAVYPNKGFIYTPRVVSGNTTSLVIDFSTDSMVKLQCNADCTVSFTNYTPGKIVEVWITNISGSQHSITHGCSSLNATNNGTTKALPATSSMRLKYFSIDGDLANTFVSVAQG